MTTQQQFLSDQTVASAIQPEVEQFVWTAPSGVTVVSEVPPVENKWWDLTLLHPIWSYASWSSMILKQYGHPGMRNYLKGKGWW